MRFFDNQHPILGLFCFENFDLILIKEALFGKQSIQNASHFNDTLKILNLRKQNS